MAENKRTLHKAVKITSSKINVKEDKGRKFEAVFPIAEIAYLESEDDPFAIPWGLTLEATEEESDSTFGTDKAPQDKGIKVLFVGITTAKVKINNENDKYVIPIVGEKGKLQSTNRASRCELLKIAGKSDEGDDDDDEYYCLISLGSGSGGASSQLCVLAQTCDGGPVLLKRLQVFEDGSYTAIDEEDDEYMSGYILDRY